MHESGTMTVRAWMWASVNATLAAIVVSFLWISAANAALRGEALPGFHAPPVSLNARHLAHVKPPHMPFYVATRGATTIWLLGTLHVGTPVDHPPRQPFRPSVIAALKASPTLALELSLDDMLAAQDDVTRYGVCAHACLPQLLPHPMWQQLKARLHGNPDALANVRRMRPWLAALQIESRASSGAGLQTEYGTEVQLQNVYLKMKNRRIVGLETRGEQMHAFTGLTLTQQREMLAQDLAQTQAQNVTDMRTLHRLWRDGDADAIAMWEISQASKLAHDKTVSGSIDERIVYQRNRRFAIRMAALAKPHRPLFVAIGALHLGGPQGVLALLRQKGFSVVAM